MQFVLEQGGWQARQEYNVQYVAYTRAERTLVFLKDVIPEGPKAEGFSLRAATCKRRRPAGCGTALLPCVPQTSASPASRVLVRTSDTDHPQAPCFAHRHDSIVRVLFNGEEGPRGRGRGGAPRTHPRDDPAWSAEAAFGDWGDFFHGSQGGASSQDGGAAEGPEHMSLVRAREVLGLPPPPAPLQQKDVTVAYRLLALQLHPDRCKDPHATQRFQEIGAAKEALERELAEETDD